MHEAIVVKDQYALLRSHLGSPELPFGQILLMVYAWISMLLYLCLICTLLRLRRDFAALRSSYYSLFLLQAIGDFYMFLTVELVMRPRKFNYFDLFSENMQGFATFSYINLLISKTVMCTGHIIISLNRFTAFYKPLEQKQIWSRRTIVGCAILIWTIAACSALPFVMVDSYSINFYLQPSGILQMYGRGLAVRAVERRLLLCALASSFPFCIEFVRSALGLYFSMDGMTYSYMITTEFWFYEVEVVVSASAWLQLIINRNLRILMFKQIFGRRFKGAVANSSNLTL
ncbi:hypothetical protein Y032_0128g1444 [Ancylostoma ceylanicum]|uniref:G-protein coupled receptors family 1 profile domain-containing protein n=1 Tax=Ancylostoma ceylanicum TaxID=53326 RepID=A0A016T7U3_9BILA|nr:hypothetical protein Y032_0128g1444 [Ancylostoma ceylanicum]